MSRTESALAQSRLAGERSETNVLERVPGLRYVPDTEAMHYDAIVETTIDPSERLPFVGICILEQGVAVEIKSTGVVYGQQQRNGRFYLRRGQHERLVGSAGVYLFAVCAPNDREIIAMKVVPATQIDHLIGNVTGGWREAGGDRDGYVQLTWTNIFEIEEVFE